VLYPDMDKITSFGAFYVNGPPGYQFKPTMTSSAPSTGTSTPSKAVPNKGR